MKDIDFFEFFIGLAIAILALGSILIGVVPMFLDNTSSEEIKQLNQSNIEIKQECEVYRNRSAEYENRCLELEKMLEGTGLVVDNCECR